MVTPQKDPHSQHNSIQNRINEVRLRINRAAERVDRSGQDIELVAVTKTVPVDQILEALKSGIHIVGENKVQEAASKTESLRSVSLHMIGSLQTNKAKRAVELFDVIQSVDRPSLAEVLDRRASDAGKKQKVLIEVKVSSEETKAGIPLSVAKDFVQGFKRYSHLDLRGLMTIAPFDRPEEETRMLFRELKRFFDQTKSALGEYPVLSMGMTDDFEWAIEEGSTMVRIGRAIFGERNYL